MRYAVTAIGALLVCALAASVWAAEDEAKTLTYSIALGDKPLGKSKYNAALWLESTDGTLLATVYVNETAAKRKRRRRRRTRTRHMRRFRVVEGKEGGEGRGHAGGDEGRHDHGRDDKQPKRRPACIQSPARRSGGAREGRSHVCFGINVAWEKEPSYVFKGSVDLSGSGPVELVFGGLGGFRGVSASDRGKSEPSKYVRSATIARIRAAGGGETRRRRPGQASSDFRKPCGERSPCIESIRRPGGRALRTRGRVLDSAARVYDLLEPLVMCLRHGRLNAEIARAVGARSGERILDVGCGTGQTSEAIARTMSGGEVTGIDSSPSMIEAASRKRAGAICRFEAALAERLPFDDESFDAAVSSHFFHHVPADLKRRAAAEMVRVLKPGGRVTVAGHRQAVVALPAHAWTARRDGYCCGSRR